MAHVISAGVFHAQKRSDTRRLLIPSAGPEVFHTHMRSDTPRGGYREIPVKLGGTTEDFSAFVLNESSFGAEAFLREP